MQTIRSYEGFRAGAPVRTAAAAPRLQAFRRMPLKIEAARVGGVEIPNQKKIEFSLQYIYGIGHTTAKAILVDSGIENKRTRELSEEELTKLREEVDKYTTEGDLRRYVSLNIKRLKEIGCYRGRRHINVSYRLFDCAEKLDKKYCLRQLKRDCIFDNFDGFKKD